MRTLPLVSALALLLPASSAAAQDARSPVVVEILGLRSWTPRMVEDSVARFQPGISLADHACAVILRDSVGFADAAAMVFQKEGDTTWVALAVVEPDMEDRVRFRAYPERRLPAPEWADLREVLAEHPQAMSPLQHPGALFGDADAFYGRPLPGETLELRRRLRTHATERDWDLARESILSDSSDANRTVAALVLSNFPGRDSTYYLLAEGLRAIDSGASTSQMVLSAITRHAPRRVEWSPARDALAALVGGTHLFSYTYLLEALVATEIDPALGREIAGRNPGLLLDFLGARNPFLSPVAHRFLVHVRGGDLGPERAAWEAWLSPPAKDR